MAPTRCSSPPLASAPRDRAFRLYFGRWSVALALLVLVAAALLPAGGLGIELCVWRRLLGAACPGCGLTRAVRHLAHGAPRLAFAHHPAAFLVLPYAALAASRPLWPRRVERGVRRFMSRRERGILGGTVVLAAVFLAFGAVRLALGLLGVWRPF